MLAHQAAREPGNYRTHSAPRRLAGPGWRIPPGTEDAPERAGQTAGNAAIATHEQTRFTPDRHPAGTPPGPFLYI